MKKISVEEMPINRRQVLRAMGCCGAALLLEGCKAAEDPYSVSDGTRSLCPYGMINDPYPGNCLAYKDLDGDGICDCSRVIAPTAAVAASVSATGALPMDFTPACELGYRYDPFPGHCHKYVDSDGSGYCDHSEPGIARTVPDEAAATSVTPEAEQPDGVTTTATPAAAVGVVCPFGMVNDPYPGQCNRYIDANGNGYCDYSEVQVIPGDGAGASAEGDASSGAAAGLPMDFVSSCRYGYKYDPYPGRCHRYIDTDGSGYCDYSEPIGVTLTGTHSGGGNGRGHGHGNG